MNVFEAIQARRSVKRFRPEPVERATIERILDVAVLAPNHRMTEPWGFLVLGAEGKQAYARVLARRRTAKLTDPEAAETVRARTMQETTAVPAIIMLTSRLDANPEIREEDYAATFMALENALLAATALGLGTHVKSGAIMDDPELREALGVAEDRRIVAILFLGAPEEVPAPKPRASAADKTVWLG